MNTQEQNQTLRRKRFVFKEIVLDILPLVYLLGLDIMLLADLYSLFWKFFVAFLIAFGFTIVPPAKRGLLLICGYRTKKSRGEGPWWLVPLAMRFEIVECTEQTEVLPYETFAAGDGIPFSFKAKIFYHVARDENEMQEGVRLKWWRRILHPGQLLYEFTNLAKGTAHFLVSSYAKQAIETEMVKYTHDKLFGFSIFELKELFPKQGDQTTPGSAVPPEAVATRNEVVAIVYRDISAELKKNGIIVTRVVLEDFNFTQKTLDFLQDILKTKFEKAAEMIDVQIDVERALKLMPHTNLTFMQVYTAMRGLDIAEVAAESGLIGSALLKLGRPDLLTQLPAAEDRKIEVVSH